MATIVDVARAAGVGLGTASRALSGSARVADETRRRVLEAADRLGYQPSRVARAFPRRRTSTIEVLVPLFARYFYFEVLRGISDALADTDYSLVIRVLERPAERDRAFATCAAPGRADGALLLSLRPTEALLARLARDPVPLVLLDAFNPSLPSVYTDHRASASAATRHCLHLGHTRLALVDRPEDPFDDPPKGPRRAGFCEALAAANLALPDGCDRVDEFSPEGGAASFEALLSLPEMPTAILAGSDMQAMGVLDAARQHGLRIPEDLSVVGYNDIELAQYLGLTTVRVPMREMGRRGIEMLLQRIEHPTAPPVQIPLPTELVVRRTCGPPPATG